MEKEIIIPRKPGRIISITVFMFLVSLLMLIPVLDYFFDFAWISSEVPSIGMIASAICLPFLLLCTVMYFKDIFNKKPVLTVNKTGIHEQMSRNSVGMIHWADIKNINIIPNMNNSYFICIVLKQPEKYIDDPKLLARLNRRKETALWGHVRLPTVYFKKEFKDVLVLIKYYFAQYAGELHFRENAF